MELVIHNKPIPAKAESDETGMVRVHICSDTHHDEFVEVISPLSTAEKEMALKLWSDPTSKRSYSEFGDTVIVSLGGN